MIHFENIINTIRDNNGFKSNKHEDSYYRLYNTSKGPIQVRISNHGTELWTWVKNAPIDPSECYANICIVLSDDGTHHSNTTADMNIYQKDDNGKNILDHDGKRIPIGRLDDFEVIQYVYNLSILSNRNVGIINKMIQQIPTKNYYYEPLQTNPQKHAKVFKLIPNKPEEILKENIDTYMKTNNRNVVRLTESQLKQMIAESVKNVLNETIYSSDDFYSNSYWGGYADKDSGEYNPLVDRAYDMQESVSHLISLIEDDIAHDEETFYKQGEQLNGACVGLYSHCKAFCEWMEKNAGEIIEKYR